MVHTIVAMPESNMSVVMVEVSSSMNIEALLAIVLKVSALALNPSNSFEVSVCELSDRNSSTNIEVLSELVSKNVFSVVDGSDGVSS